MNEFFLLCSTFIKKKLATLFNNRIKNKTKFPFDTSPHTSLNPHDIYVMSSLSSSMSYALKLNPTENSFDRNDHHKRRFDYILKLCVS